MFRSASEYLTCVMNKLAEQGERCGGHPGGEPCQERLAVWMLNLPPRGLHLQLAHRIPKTKANLKKYGERIINHPINLVLVCSLRCNDSVLVGAAKPLTQRAIVEEIEKELEGCSPTS